MKNPFLILLLCCNSIVFAQSADSLKNSIAITYDYQHFEQSATNWHIAGLSYTKKNKGSTYIGNLRYANRFKKSGWQAEGEAYPILSKKVYAYTSLSYSADMPVFPKWRAGTSLFVSFAKTWEAEGGLRYLYFDKNIFIGTAGISKYLGLWLLNFRSFASLTNEFNDPSFFLSARRYFKNEKDYGWIQIGTGFSPDETRNVQYVSNNSLSSKLILAGVRKTLIHNLAGIFSAGWSKDELVQDVYDHRFYGTIGLQQYF